MSEVESDTSAQDAIEVNPALDYEERFGVILADLETLEDRNEVYFADLLDAQDRFFLSWNPDGTFEEFQRLGDEWANDQVNLGFEFDSDMRPLIAQLVAERLEASEHGDLDRVRDAAVAHYTSWLDFTTAYTQSIFEWVYVSEGSIGWLDYSQEQLAEYNTEINETFMALCSGLADEQPAGGEFTRRIASMCES